MAGFKLSEVYAKGRRKLFDQKNNGRNYKRKQRYMDKTANYLNEIKINIGELNTLSKEHD